MSDQLTKAMTRDGFLRIYAVVSTETCNTAQKYHQLSPVASAALGRLLAAGQLMGSMLKNKDASLTLQLKGDGPLGTVLVSADACGDAKGYVSNPMVDIPLKKNGKLDVGAAVGKGTLSVIKDLKLKEPYIGQIPIQTGEIGDDLAFYFMQSEQVPSVVGLGVLVDRDYSIKCAGGFIIQVMPDCDEKTLSKIENSIKNMMNVTEMLEKGMDSIEMIRYVMLGFDVEILETNPVRYHCNCSEERMERALISLGKKELREMIEDTGEAEIVCHFCNHAYVFDKSRLKMLEEKATRA